MKQQRRTSKVEHPTSHSDARERARWAVRETVEVVEMSQRVLDGARQTQDPEAIALAEAALRQAEASAWNAEVAARELGMHVRDILEQQGAQGGLASPPAARADPSGNH